MAWKRWGIVLGLVVAMGNQVLGQNVDGIRYINGLVQSEQYDTARQFIRMVSSNPNDYQFLEAEIAQKQGNYGKAIKILRELVAQKPDFNLARFRLAELLQIDKQYDNARYQLTILRDQSQNPNERQFFTNQIQNLGEKQTFGLNFEISAFPSNNINNASDIKQESLFWGLQYDVPEELRPQFGWQYGIGVNGYHRLHIKNQHEILSNFSAVYNTYSVDTLDYATTYLSLNYHYQNARTDFRVGPYISRYMGDGEAYKTVVNAEGSSVEIIKRDEDYYTIGMSASARYILSSRQAIGASLGYSETTYDDQEQYGTRDSYDKKVGLNYRYSIDPRNLMQFDLDYARHVELGNDEDWSSFNSYNGFGVGISLSTYYPNQWQTEMGLSYNVRQYDEDYPFMTDPRRDEILGVDFSVLNSKWQIGKFVPKLKCRYQTTSSNVEARAIDSGQCGLVLTSEF